MKQSAYFCNLSVVLLMLCAPLSAQQAPQGSGPETVEVVEKIGVQGNWVKKRELLLKSNEVNTQIQELAGQTEAIRKSFMDRYSTIDTALDAYYKSIGLEQGKLQELFDDILRYLEKKRKKEIANLGITQNQPIDLELQAKIDLVEGSISASKQQLEQLKLDMKSVEDLDHSLSDRIKRVDETIASITSEAARANEIIEALWSIIDHNKARDSYYDLTNNILEKIKAFQAYLSGDLSQDFDTVIATVQSQITRTQDGIKKLEDDGLFIKNRAQRVQEIKLKETAEKNAAAQQATTPETTPTTKGAKLQPVAWYTSIYNHIVAFFTSMYRGLIIIKQSITDAFWPAKPQVKKMAATATTPPPPLPLIPNQSTTTTQSPSPEAPQLPQTPPPAQDLQSPFPTQDLKPAAAT